MDNVRGRIRFRSKIGTVIVGGIVIALTGSLVFGQAPVEFRGGVAFGTTRYDDQIANQFDLSTRGWGFQGIFAPRFFGYTSLLAEFGWEYWAQVCLDPSDCQPDRGSTSSIMGSLGAGLATPLLYVDDPEVRWGFGLTFYAGREWIKAGLSEGDCLNCTIDDLDVSGGYWIEGGLDVSPDPSITVGFVYRQYESSADMNSRISIRFIGQWY